MAVTVFEGNLESVQKKVDELKKVYPDLKVEYWTNYYGSEEKTRCRINNLHLASFDGDFHKNEQGILEFIDSNVK